jgi:Leucine-rich repeat (LRR) protein
MKYFGIASLLIVVTVGVLWSTGSFTGGQYVDENGDTQNTSYQEAIDSAQNAADSISEAGTPRIEIYDGISFFPDTTVINLSGRNLTGSLKAEIRKLSDLEVLDISNNDFTGLPAEIGQLSKLKTLNVSNNPITGLPREIGQLQNLELFNLLGTEYSEQDLTAIQALLSDTTSVIVD